MHSMAEPANAELRPSRTGRRKRSAKRATVDAAVAASPVLRPTWASEKPSEMSMHWRQRSVIFAQLPAAMSDVFAM